MTDSNATPSTTPHPPQPLQFDRVDAGPEASPADQSATLKCESCGNEIRVAYYHVNGISVCARCKEVAVEASQSPRGAGVFFKSLIFGGVAALIGAAIYYAVIAITNFEIGLVAILIGFMVGAAVRKATGGRGGRKFQVLALLLTYFAVGVAYMPLAIKGAMDGSKSTASVADSATSGDSSATAISDSSAVPSAAVATLAGAPAADSTSAVSDSTNSATALGGNVFVALAIVLGGGFLFIWALPVIAVVGSLPSGIISAMIIGFGMHQAWKMTGAFGASVSGPYRVGSASPAADTPAASA